MDSTNIAILVLFILVIILVCKIQFKNLSVEKFMDMAKQSFIFKESKKKWIEAHSGMYSALSKHPYITFDQFYKADPQSVYFPTNLNELTQIVKDNENHKIRVSGGHHTFNDISITNDVIIRTFNLKKILDLNREKKEITVESGITLDELCIYLEKYNLGLHVLPAIPYQTIGGVIGTATHGSRLGMGSLSDAIRDMTVVLANGNIRRIEFDDPEFPAFTTSLGALGIIYSVTLQCVDLYAVNHQREESTWKRVQKLIPQLIEEYPFLQIYIDPYSPNLKTTIYRRKIADLSPAEVDKYKRVGYTQSVKKTQDQTGIYYRILTRNEEEGHYTEAEVGIPYERCTEAVNDVLTLFRSHKRVYGYDTKKPLLIRFTGPDYNSWLSMTSGRPTCFLDVYKEAPFTDPDKHLKFFKDFENLLIYKYKGRPHWGKRNFLDQHTARLVYGLSIDYFNRIRNRYDPDHTFTNEYIERILGV